MTGIAIFMMEKAVVKQGQKEIQFNLHVSCQLTNEEFKVKVSSFFHLTSNDVCITTHSLLCITFWVRTRIFTQELVLHYVDFNLSIYIYLHIYLSATMCSAS